jgi:hypothetical protein
MITEIKRLAHEMGVEYFDRKTQSSRAKFCCAKKCPESIKESFFKNDGIEKVLPFCLTHVHRCLTLAPLTLKVMRKFSLSWISIKNFCLWKVSLQSRGTFEKRHSRYVII